MESGVGDPGDPPGPSAPVEANVIEVRVTSHDSDVNAAAGPRSSTHPKLVVAKAFKAFNSILGLLVLMALAQVAKGVEVGVNDGSKINYEALSLYARTVMEAAKEKDLDTIREMVQQMMKELPSRNMVYVGVNFESGRLSTGRMDNWSGSEVSVKVDPFSRDVLSSAHLAHNPKVKLPTLCFGEKGVPFEEKDGPNTYVRNVAAENPEFAVVYTKGSGSYNTEKVVASKQRCDDFRRELPRIQDLMELNVPGKMVLLSEQFYCPSEVVKIYPDACLLTAGQTIARGDYVTYVKSYVPLASIVGLDGDKLNTVKDGDGKPQEGKPPDK